MRKLVAGAALAALVASSALAQGSIQTGVAFGFSNKPVVQDTITSARASVPFNPIAGRVFHLQLSGTAVATCFLERQLDKVTWVPITVTANGLTLPVYSYSYNSSALSEDLYEAQAGTLYRLDCGGQTGSFGSGALSVGFFQ